MENLELAFSTLETVWNIPHLLDTNDFLLDPDEVSILVFLALCLEHLEQ